ncbi:MAG: hypothetical protein WC792_02500 [Candidatus Micrarchaeia archaeon]|jgi:riboflavin synthase
MKLGFVDCASNLMDPYEAFSKMAEEKVSNLASVRLTASDLLKVPLTAKKLLSQGADAAVVFLIISEEDFGAVSLVHEKMIDVELAAEKYVFFCIVSEDEFSTNEQLESLVEERFKTLLDLAVNSLNSPSEVSKAIGDADMASAFSALAGFSAAVSGGSEEGDTNAEGALPEMPSQKEEDDVHSLF